MNTFPMRSEAISMAVDIEVANPIRTARQFIFYPPLRCRVMENGIRNCLSIASPVMNCQIESVASAILACKHF